MKTSGTAKNSFTPKEEDPHWNDASAAVTQAQQPTTSDTRYPSKSPRRTCVHRETVASILLPQFGRQRSGAVLYTTAAGHGQQTDRRFAWVRGASACIQGVFLARGLHAHAANTEPDFGLRKPVWTCVQDAFSPNGYGTCALRGPELGLDARLKAARTICATTRKPADTLFSPWAGRFEKASKFCRASGSISAAGASVPASDPKDCIWASVAVAPPGSPAGSAPCTTTNPLGPAGGNTVAPCPHVDAAPISVC